ncbi:MAG: hypothetical protein RL291_699 [Pseudomonadota bacterium]
MKDPGLAKRGRGFYVWKLAKITAVFLERQGERPGHAPWVG